MRWIAAACAAFALCLSAGPATARLLEIRYRATDAYGSEAPPGYGLRVDGVFDGIDEVTFHLNDVVFDVFDDGSAWLHGVVSVAEVGGAPPGAFASSWDLSVDYQRDPGFAGNPLWQYFHLIPRGGELVRQTDATDVIDLSEAPADGSMPFELGSGVFPGRKCTPTSTSSSEACLGGTGWLFWTHGSFTRPPEGAADFIMNLAREDEPADVPEPGVLPLLGLGLSALVLARGRRAG